MAERDRKTDPRCDELSRPEGGPGASGTSGGGAGAGVADGDMLMNIGDPAPDSDAQRDREKLFGNERNTPDPDAVSSQDPAGAKPGNKSTSVDRDTHQ